MLSREAGKNDFILFDLTQHVLETTIYCIRDEHTNSHTIDLQYGVSKASMDNLVCVLELHRKCQNNLVYIQFS